MSEFAQAIIDGVLLGGLYAMMAIGLSLCLGIVRVVNFAHGEFIMLGAYGSYWLLTLLGLDPLESFLIVAAAGFVFGFLVFRVVMQRVLEAPPLNQILLTFGIGMILQNLAIVLWSGDARSVAPWYATEAIQLGQLMMPDGQVIALIVLILMVAVLTLWLARTELGRACRALAQNRDSARLMGIDTGFVYALSFGISAALATAAGVIMSFLVTITPFMGFNMVIKSFAIIVLGGFGSISGAILGALALGLSETFVSYYVPDGIGWSEGVASLLLFVVLIIRPTGLFGRAGDSLA